MSVYMDEPARGPDRATPTPGFGRAARVVFSRMGSAAQATLAGLVRAHGPAVDFRTAWEVRYSRRITRGGLRAGPSSKDAPGDDGISEGPVIGYLLMRRETTRGRLVDQDFVFVLLDGSDAGIGPWPTQSDARRVLRSYAANLGRVSPRHAVIKPYLIEEEP